MVEIVVVSATPADEAVGPTGAVVFGEELGRTDVVSVVVLVVTEPGSTWDRSIALTVPVYGI